MEINSKHKTIIFGYLRNEFNKFNNIYPELVAFICFAYYNDCDEISSYWSDYDISCDHTRISGCGYGNIQIDTNNTKYNHYQWLIGVNNDNSPIIIGITQYKDTNNPWWFNRNYVHYEFRDAVMDYYHYKWIDNFNTGDIILLDLNIKTAQFILFVNGNLKEIKQSIHCNSNKYYLAVHAFNSDGFVNIEQFAQFNDDDDNTKYKSLISFDGEFINKYTPFHEKDMYRKFEFDKYDRPNYSYYALPLEPEKEAPVSSKRSNCIISKGKKTLIHTINGFCKYFRNSNINIHTRTY